MSGDTTDKKGSASQLPDADELLGALDEWDKTFDTLHAPDDEDEAAVKPLPVPAEPEQGAFASEDTTAVPVGEDVVAAPAPPSATPAPLPPQPAPLDLPPSLDAPPVLAQPDELGDLFGDPDFSFGEAEALGSLLGQPTDAPATDKAKPADDDEVYTSAVRPAPVLAPAPTDDELFGDLPAQVPDADAARRAAGADATRDPNADIETGVGEVHSEATRIAPDIEALARSTQAKRDRPRGPAIVRRADLEKRRAAQAAAAGQPAEAKAAEAAAAAAAEAFFSEADGPTLEFEVDGDFYDDIEIGESSPELEAPPPMAATKPKRALAHVVRRAATAPVFDEPVDENEVVLEIEAESSDEYYAADISGETQSVPPSAIPADSATEQPAVVIDSAAVGIAAEVLPVDAREAVVFDSDMELGAAGAVAAAPVAHVEAADLLLGAAGKADLEAEIEVEAAFEIEPEIEVEPEVVAEAAFEVEPEVEVVAEAAIDVEAEPAVLHAPPAPAAEAEPSDVDEAAAEFDESATVIETHGDVAALAAGEFGGVETVIEAADVVDSMEAPPPAVPAPAEEVSEVAVVSEQPATEAAVVAPPAGEPPVAAASPTALPEEPEDAFSEDGAKTQLNTMPPVPLAVEVAPPVEDAFGDDGNTAIAAVPPPPGPPPAATGDIPPATEDAFGEEVSTFVGFPEPPTPAPPAAEVPSLPDAPVRDVSGPISVADDVALEEVDVAPELPPSKFPDTDAAVDFTSLVLPEQVEPDLSDRSEDLAQTLLVYERELELLDEPTLAARLRLETGRIAEQLGDLERARTHYDLALTGDERLVSALRAVRRVDRAAGNWNDAVATVDTQMPHGSPVEQRALAAHRIDLLIASGERDLARVAAGELLDHVGGDVRTLLANLELSYIDGRDDEFARSLGTLASALESPSLRADVLTIRGRVEESTGDREAAAASYRAAIESDPACLAAHRGRTRLAIAAGSADTAAAVTGGIAAAEVESRDPAFAAALWWRGSMYAADDQTRRTALARAAELRPTPSILAELADASEAAGDHEAAVRALLQQAHSASDPAVTAATYSRAARLLSGPIASPADAVEALRRVVDIDPADSSASAALEHALLAAGDLEGLVDVDRRAIAAEPGAVYRRVRLARRLMAVGRTDEALAAIEADAAAHPAVVHARLRVLAVAGRLAEAATLSAELADAEVEWLDNIEALRSAASMAEYAASIPPQEGADPEARRRALLTAIELWQRVLELDPESQPAHEATAYLSALLGDADVLESALAMAQTAAAVPSRSVGIALQRVALLLSKPEPDAAFAEDVLREAQALAPDDPRTVLPLVALATRAGRWEDAAMVMEERVSNLGDTSEAHELQFRAATMLLDRCDDPARAAEMLAAVIDAHPEFAAASELLDTAHRKLGDTGAIAADLDREAAKQRALSGAGGDAFATLTREAELYEHQMGDPARALSLYRKALEIRPGDPLVRDGYTRAAFNAGEAAPLGQLALADLKAAEENADGAAKADAYEQLARIDAELRGDEGSALLALESASAADPARHTLLRALERAYARAGSRDSLYKLLGSQLAALGDTADAAVVATLRAQLGTALERSADAVRGDYERVLSLLPTHRLALFNLEAPRRSAGASEPLAVLEQQIANYFAGDHQSQAAFLTRAGETLAELGERDRAIDLFRRATEMASGYVPALNSWRHTALSSEQWLDVAEAATKEAAVTGTDAERAALHHMAGVAFMDKALQAERAVPSLRAVLAIDPTHTDAFVRLRILLDEEGEHEDLATLLRTRLEVETDGSNRVELLLALANLHRNFLDDRDAAKDNLRDVLSLDPSNKGAVADLSDIAWEQGAWAEAAQALIARAKLETDPKVLKGIFYRLGTVYTDRLPDARWALKSFERVLSYDPNDQGALARIADLAVKTEDWKLALGATERLVKVEQDPARKIKHLHRAGHIFEQGFGDSTRAERVYRHAIDVDPSSEEALEALIGFYQARGDVRSMRVHLDRVAAAMRMRLGTNAADGVAFRMAARALAAREKAGVRGSLGAARCGAELAHMLGAAEASDIELAAGAADSRPPLLGLVKPETEDLLFPRSVPSGLRQLFRSLGDRLAKHVGVDVRRYGVGRGERLRKDDPVAAIVHDVARDLGIEQLDIYVSSRQTSVIAAELTSPISLILGSAVASPDRPAVVRFAAGCALELATTSLSVAGQMEQEQFSVLLTALLRQFEPEYTTAGVDPEAVSVEQQRLRRLIPSGMVHELHPFAVGIAGANLDHAKVHTAIRHAGHRAGLLASGSVAAALALLCKQRGLSDIHDAAQDPLLAALMRFAVSEDHAGLRGMLEV